MVAELLRERLFGGSDKSGERLFIVDGDLGEHLAVDDDARFLEAIHEFGIGDVVETASGVDPLDPKLAVVALDEATGIVGITKRMANLFFRGLEEKMLGTKVTFGSL